MKKTVGILSVLLALTIAVNAITPAMSVTIQKVFSPEPRVASVMDSVFSDEYVSGEDDAASNGKTATGTAPDKQETAYDDGKILIYNFEQLSMIGSGKSYTYEDGVTATFANDAAYKLAQDISVPRHTVWQLPDGFTGKITGEKQSYAPLYDAQKDAIYLYNPYQLAVMAMENREEQPVMSGDADAPTFGSGKVVCTDEANKHILTYSDDRNYVISAQFSSEVTEKPISVSSKKSVEAVGAKADNTVGAAAPYDGRDFAGQVIKKINGKTYILIGNEDQLRAIGTDEEVYTPVYELHYVVNHYEVLTRNGKQVQLYGGDADLEESQNGYADFSFQDIHSGHPRAGVNQETGQVYTDAAHVDISWPDLLSSWKTGEKYTTNSNYIIFRDIDLGGQSKPWTPLMFTGNMYGIKSVNNDKLWNGDAIGNATEMTARTTANRPVISNVYVNNSNPIEVNKFIGIGFFATVTNEVNTADIGISSGTVHVENLELSQVAVHNTATTAKSTQTILGGLTTGVGWLVGGLVDLVGTALSFGSMELSLHDTLSSLLNARAIDPTIFATGGFAGRIVGDVQIFNCAVTGSVTVENAKDRTGGFIGYSEGITQYSGLSQALGISVDALSSLLNAIPGLGLGDLITILLKNALPVRNLIPTGYIAPKLKNCTVNGLTGDVGTTAANMAGGFVGQQIGTRIEGCSVKNSTYNIKATNYGGGFCGLERDAEIKGTLDGVGVDLSSLIQNIHPQSVLINCKIDDCAYNVTGENYLGGFVGSMTSSYAVDSTIDCGQKPISLHGTGDYVGGFAGYATVGWQSSLGKNENTEKSLLGTVRQLVTSLLSTDQAAGQKLLSLMGVSPSAIMGCQVYSSELTVQADGSFAGGLVGKGDGIYLGKSDQAAYDALAGWNSGTLKETPQDTPVVLTGLKSVTAGEDYAGGVAGYMGSAAFQGLLNDVVGLGDFIGFNANNITVTGVGDGYTVTAGQVDAGGAFGCAVGGIATKINLFELKRVQARNRAAGFVGIAGPGELVGTGGLTVNLLGLDKVLKAKNLLNVGQGIEVKINSCNVTGIADGFEVEATGTNPSGAQTVYEFTAAGFIADSNSTDISDSHVDKLKSVTATDTNGFAGGFIGTSETGGLAEAANNDANGLSSFISNEDGTSILEINKLVDAVGYLIPSYTNCTTTFVNGGLVDADIAGGFVADLESGTVDNTTIATVDDPQNPKWTKTMKELNDPDAVNPMGDLEKQFAVFNIDTVHGRTFGGGFGGKLRSGALASAGGGLSILGTSRLSINLNDLAKVMNTYVPFVKHAGVYSKTASPSRQTPFVPATACPAAQAALPVI